MKKYEVNLTYTIEVEARNECDAISAATYELLDKDNVTNLNMSIIGKRNIKTANDAQPVIAAKPHSHTDITVHNDTPVASQPVGPVDPLPVDAKPEPTKVEVDGVLL